MSVIRAVGCVHGRFQPPHNEHLRYILAAKARCEFLWIGLTQYDLASLRKSAAAHRIQPRANPLTYWERMTVISRMLLDQHVDRSAFGFVPFPIEEPSHLYQFMSKSVVCYTTICEEWNEHKIRDLCSEGYAVEILWKEQIKKVEGREIRAMMAAGDEGWLGLVPPAVAEFAKEVDLVARIRTLPDGA